MGKSRGATAKADNFPTERVESNPARRAPPHTPPFPKNRNSPANKPARANKPIRGNRPA